MPTWPNSEYNDAPEPEGNGDRVPLPVGKYTCRIAHVRIDLNSKSDKPIIRFQLEAVDGEFRGCKGEKTVFLETLDNLRYFKADLHKLGMVLDNLSDIETRWQELVGLYVFTAVQLAKDGKSINVFFNKLMPPVPEYEAEVNPGGVPNDPAPTTPDYPF